MRKWSWSWGEVVSIVWWGEEGVRWSWGEVVMMGKGTMGEGGTRIILAHNPATLKKTLK